MRRAACEPRCCNTANVANSLCNNLREAALPCCNGSWPGLARGTAPCCNKGVRRAASQCHGPLFPADGLRMMCARGASAQAAQRPIPRNGRSPLRRGCPPINPRPTPRNERATHAMMVSRCNAAFAMSPKSGSSVLRVFDSVLILNPRYPPIPPGTPRYPPIPPDTPR